LKGEINVGRERVYKYVNRRAEFSGVFVRFGVRKFDGTQTALILDIRDGYGERIADHAWINDAEILENLNVCTGDQVQFNALIRVYRDGDSVEAHRPTEAVFKFENVLQVRLIHKKENHNGRKQSHQQAHRTDRKRWQFFQRQDRNVSESGD